MDFIISENIKRIQYDIEEAKVRYRKSDDVIKLMAVTKTVPYEYVNYAVNEGITLIGENRVQEYLSKKDFYDKQAEVHFIGHLQSNKIKYIADSVTLIHSVDSIKLATEIDKQAEQLHKCMNVLIEVNIGREESKNGVFPEMLDELIYEASQLRNISIHGLMTIPPIFSSEESFEKMQRLFNDLQAKRIDNTCIDTLSMGMSSDYALAVKYGSNIVRIGSGLFGARK